MGQDYKSSITKLQECLVTIDSLSRNILEVTIELGKKQIDPSNVIWKNVSRYMFIQLCSFFGELQLLDALSGNDRELRSVMKVISPIRDVIRKWSGITNTRNRMFAHYNRDKNNKFYPWWKTLEESNIPGTPHEALFVSGLVHLVNIILLSKYRNIFDSAFYAVRSEYEESLRNINSHVFLTREEIEKIQTNLSEALEINMKDAGIELTIDSHLADLFSINS